MRWLPVCFLFLSATIGARSVPIKKYKCGYEACAQADPNALNVHLVAHSHDDVGWLKTVDQYYYGANNSIQHAGVQYIIDSVVMALRKNPERKFIQVESAYLWKWWREQTKEKQKEFVDLVNDGQLEIVGGGWSMNDESAVNYQSTIDQFTLGLQYIHEILGECGRPKIGWQIDPFGHTREMASIFAQLGFDAFFFARLDWRDKGERLQSKTAELLWRGSANLKNDSFVFTHALYNHYSPPPGFYFDVLSNDDPLIADLDSIEYNLDFKMKDFKNYVIKQARSFTTNNIIITMGNDFTYQDAHYSFKNLDILIKSFKDTPQYDDQGRRINLFYSTPACYVKAVNEDSERNRITFKVKTDDFIPYASDYHTYWSGYYTSRPTQKRFERQGNNFLQVMKQLTTLSGRSNANLFDLKSAMGMMQHHDAITGTEKQHVAQDYARIVAKAFAKSQRIANEALQALLGKADEKVNLQFESCMLANVSHCGASQEKRFVVAIHNPLSRQVSKYVRLPVNSDRFTIVGPNGKQVKWQVVPTIDAFDIPDIQSTKFDLVFLAKDLPPLGIHLFYITDDNYQKPPNNIPDSDSFVLGDDQKIQVHIDPQNGFMHSATLKGLTLPIRQELMYYIGAQGNNMVFENRSSGAYIFRPDPKRPAANAYTQSLMKDLHIYKGELVDEVHQVFNDWNRQIIRVYKEENHIEFDWLVGPIDIEDNQGKEVISRFTTNLNHDSFLTDSNGRELINRRNDYRATYNYSKEETTAGNYYPVTSGITIVDESKSVELTVLTDRAQGGASLQNGQLELMVHRRLLKDDAFGVGEALNETEFGKGMVARGQHYLTFGDNSSSGKFGYARKKQREIAQRKLLAPWVFVANAKEYTLESVRNSWKFEYAGLTKSLPDEVQILTMENWDEDTVLLRFEHIFEQNEGSGDINVDLNGLFANFKVVSLEETTLGANQKLEDNTRLEWNVGNCLPGLHDCGHLPNKTPAKKSGGDMSSLVIKLRPMQIRTFKAKVSFN